MSWEVVADMGIERFCPGVAASRFAIDLHYTGAGVAAPSLDD